MSPATVKCPTCGRPLEWTGESPFRPFCSDRCRLIDLGAWLSEERGIAGEAVPTEPAPTKDSDPS
ncbi:MAG TPA: DNA gyrase inhibitor YacG [Steroidobacteraceae bacterium]|nr:DNA gyrase inhibitor YacG [Steroidobacteraceae bacterium]